MKSSINVVLVEPQIPQNTGNVARTCRVTGARLHLIKPLGFSTEDKQLKRAGLDYWHELDITYYENISQFFAQNKGKCFFYTTKSKHLYTEVSYEGEVYLIFGREDKGLPESLLSEHYEQTVRVPMLDGQRSLNLSNTVAIGTYEVLRQHDFENLQTKGELSCQQIEN